MLAQFALIVFGMFAVLTLVTDLGYVTLTRVQMQNAADTAALEGLRRRNISPDDGFQADCLRRMAARDVVRLMFDDDFNPLNGDPRQFGAGPIIQFDGGDAELNALQTMSIPAVYSYKPNLQLNQVIPGIAGANFDYGDMVSGTYTFDPANPSTEDGAYVRSDFARNPAAPAPGTSGYAACPDPVPDPWIASGTGPLVGPDDHAFLVRLRRTNDTGGLDNVAGVSSAQGALPLLFGRGTTIEGRQPGGGYSPRHDGITVRATAIADARPALRVGLPAAGWNGATPFALERAFFANLNDGDPSGPPPVTATIDAATGLITDVDGNVVGRFVADPLSIGTVGAALPPAIPRTCDPAKTVDENAINGFGPVYTTIGPSATSRIIGFGRVELSWPDCGHPTDVQLLRGLAEVVAVGNATALLSDGFPQDLLVSDVSELMVATRGFAPAQGGLLVATLAR